MSETYDERCPTCMKNFKAIHKYAKFCSTPCAFKDFVLQAMGLETKEEILNYIKTLFKEEFED